VATDALRHAIHLGRTELYLDLTRDCRAGRAQVRLLAEEDAVRACDELLKHLREFRNLPREDPGWRRSYQRARELQQLFIKAARRDLGIDAVGPPDPE
jgi:hypothetical protein